MRIDRCLCVGVTFEALKKQADAASCSTVEELRCVAEFGTGCGLCRPYVREMLRTGETVFDRIITEVEDA
ncbi:MAG: (2Fe-2S)-binding protein [Rhodothermales bacterium]|nr:(2Fe-2S)-binding protein [Rhodothermales bacterium]